MHHHSMFHPMGVISFFLFGMVTSLHCIGMCGPISSLFFQIQKQNSPWRLLIYHTSRMISYSLIGFGIGLAGVEVQQFIPFSWITIFLCVLLVLYALPIRIPSLPLYGIFQKMIPMSVLTPRMRSLLLGFFSPLLPCAPLYMAFASCAAAPTPYYGLVWMMCFALGTIPLHFLSQLSFGLVFFKTKGTYQTYLIKILSLATAGFIYWMQFSMHST